MLEGVLVWGAGHRPTAWGAAAPWRCPTSLYSPPKDAVLPTPQAPSPPCPTPEERLTGEVPTLGGCGPQPSRPGQVARCHQSELGTSLAPCSTPWTAHLGRAVLQSGQSRWHLERVPWGWGTVTSASCGWGRVGRWCSPESLAWVPVAAQARARCGRPFPPLGLGDVWQV